jgi:hypothetical protein
MSIKELSFEYREYVLRINSQSWTLKQNRIYFFWIFLKYWPSSRDFNKLVIKAKMHAKTHFFLKFSLLYENTI